MILGAPLMAYGAEELLLEVILRNQWIWANEDMRYNIIKKNSQVVYCAAIRLVRKYQLHRNTIINDDIQCALKLP
jgi:hypothetical protein